MDLGAHDATYHSRVLGQLTRWGFVERQTRGSNRSYRYRLSGLGRAVAATIEYPNYPELPAS
jgi:hypothetical protein